MVQDIAKVEVCYVYRYFDGKYFQLAVIEATVLGSNAGNSAVYISESDL